MINCTKNELKEILYCDNEYEVLRIPFTENEVVGLQAIFNNFLFSKFDEMKDILALSSKTESLLEDRLEIDKIPVETYGAMPIELMWFTKSTIRKMLSLVNLHPLLLENLSERLLEVLKAFCNNTAVLKDDDVREVFYKMTLKDQKAFLEIQDLAYRVEVGAKNECSDANDDKEEDDVPFESGDEDEPGNAPVYVASEHEEENADIPF